MAAREPDSLERVFLRGNEVTVSCDTSGPHSIETFYLSQAQDRYGVRRYPIARLNSEAQLRVGQHAVHLPANIPGKAALRHVDT